MRGTSEQQIESLIALTPEGLVPRDHPIRRIKPLAARALRELSPTFSRMYAKVGRPSVRSERQFCERLGYDMLFRWFLDLNVRGRSFDQSTFAKNRARLLEHEVTGEFFREERPKTGLNGLFKGAGQRIGKASVPPSDRK